MELRDKVLNFFCKYSRAISIKQLAKKLDVGLDNLDELCDVLYSLEQEGFVMGSETGEYIHVPDDYYLTFGEVHQSAKNNFYIKLDCGGQILIDDKNNSYHLVEGDKVFVETRQSLKHKKQLLGTVVRLCKRAEVGRRTFLFKAKLKKSHSNNYFYVELNGRKYYILDQYVMGAYVGDEVTVEGRVLKDSYIGIIRGIVKRKTNRHVFTVRKLDDGTITLDPVGTVYYEVNPDFNLKGFEDGDNLILEIDDKYNAKFIKTIEPSDDLDKRIRILAYDNGIPVDFSSLVLEEAKHIDTTIENKELKNRVDLRDLVTFTIDSETAKDLDDAISLEVLPDRYRLYVSIADVSYYVYPGTKIFEAALERRTSIYPANTVIPMLPKKLSNEVCSLNEGDDKLTKTCIIDIDFEGNILDHKVINSIIRSNKKMSYSDVNRVLDGEDVLGYQEYKNILLELQKLSNLLESRRVNRGFISFVNDEVMFEYDEDGNVCGIKTKDSGEGQLIIENCMLIANECVAELAYNLEVPFVYRNHESPSISKLYQLKYRIKGFHKYLSSLSSAQNPKLLQKIFTSICEGKSSYEVEFLSKMMLRSMSRAFYSSDNYGHYGLALNVYATFTSPIRRLPDLLNHIVLNYIIEGKYDELEQFIDKYADWALNATITQMESEEFEKNIDILLMNKYTDQFIGQVLKGRIVFIYENRVYIETNNGLYGYFVLNNNNIKDDEIKIYGQKYHIGSFVDVLIDKCDDANNEILFKLVKPTLEDKDEEKIKILERSENNG